MKERSAHVIAEIDYRTPVPREQAPMTCACGWEGTAGAFEEHRRTAPKEGPTMGRREPTAKQQAAWDLVTVEGLSQVEAADRLGITQGGVQSRLRGYMEATDTTGPLPGYGGGNGPITFRRVAPEALDAPATTSATETPVPSPVEPPASEALPAEDEPVAAADPDPLPGSAAGDHALQILDARAREVLVADPLAEEVPASGGMAPASSVDVTARSTSRARTRDLVGAATARALELLDSEVARLGDVMWRLDEEIRERIAEQQRLQPLLAAATTARDAYRAHVGTEA